MALSQGPQARLTILYCSTDCLCGCGAAVENLAHSASLHSEDKNAPSNPGIKHLMGWSAVLLPRLLVSCGASSHARSTFHFRSSPSAAIAALSIDLEGQHSSGRPGRA